MKTKYWVTRHSILLTDLIGYRLTRSILNDMLYLDEFISLASPTIPTLESSLTQL